MSYEFEFDDVEYNDYNGVLVVECEPYIDDPWFDAYNEMGVLQKYGTNKLTGVTILGATLFKIGNNGEELGEVEFTGEEVNKEFTWADDSCFEKLQDKEVM